MTDFHRRLDAIFDAGRGATDAEPYLRATLARAEDDGDAPTQLAVLNEMAGFYRSVSRHADALSAADRALLLVESMGVGGTDAHATTLINAATASRAAGRHDEALARYREALTVAHSTMPDGDRRLAALHNNLSMAYSETGAPGRAREELEEALGILRATTTDPGADLDIATTLTNLALVCFTLGEHEVAQRHADASMAIYRTGRHENHAHFASALSGHAEASFRMGRYDDAVVTYRQALGIIEQAYGRGSDYYQVTAENLATAEAAAVRARPTIPDASALNPAESQRPPAPVAAPHVPHPPAHAGPDGGKPSPDRGEPEGSAQASPSSATGMRLARDYWQTYGPELLAAFPGHRGRIAAGLVGHGSECYGFDDALSRDHDFGPGFCLWLTAADHAEIGAELQAAYDALPDAFGGVGPRTVSPRARGRARRVGVFEIGDFYAAITGYRDAPAPDALHEWLMLEEATLAAATNGAVFADPFGAFSKVRGDFKRMPKDVRLALVSRRLGMISQAGQYNLPRMLARGEGEAAWLAIGEFTRATASLVFLLNNPATVGYLPYYKWQFAALRRLSGRMASRLPEVVGELSQVLSLGSAACFGGAGFGEGGKGAAPAREQIGVLVEGICTRIVTELRARGMTRSEATFLEWQRPYVEEGIAADWLRSL